MKLFFVGITDLRGIAPNRDHNEPLQLSLNQNGGLIIIDRTKPQGSSETTPELSKTLRAKVQLHVDVSEEGYKFVSDLFEKRYSHYGPNAPQLPITRKWPKVVDGVTVHEETIRVDTECNILLGVPFIAYPDEIKELCQATRREIESHIRAVIGLLCWRYSLDPGPDLFDFVHLYWATKEGPAERVAEYRETEFYQRRLSINLAPEVQADIQPLLNEGKSEPLGRELLREASSLFLTAPRSCLLIAVSALEAGVKAHLGELVPNARWILEESPSPPIVIMLRQYLPQLHKNLGHDVAFWKAFATHLNDFEDLIKYRNKLAHLGQIPKMKKTLKHYMQAISDVLYALDVLRGNEWAKERVHFKIKKQLLWPGHDKQHVEIGVGVVSD